MSGRCGLLATVGGLGRWLASLSGARCIVLLYSVCTSTIFSAVGRMEFVCG